MPVLRPNEFHRKDNPDYSVIWKEDDREKVVGRIFHDPNGTSLGGREWWWGVNFFQWEGRAEPRLGRARDRDEAMALWRQCWDSADVPVKW